jgi:hypothetical protein
MGTTEHLALQKFEAIDMPLCDAVTPLERASCMNGGVIATNPIDKAGEFGHLAGFCSAAASSPMPLPGVL